MKNILILLTIILSLGVNAADVKMKTPSDVIDYMYGTLNNQMSRTMPTGNIDRQTCLLQYKSTNGNTRAVKRLLVSHLVLADALLGMGGKDAQNGIEISSAALSCSMQILKDEQLSAGIAMTFIVPNITSATTDEVSDVCRVSLLKDCVGAVDKVGDKEAILSLYRLMIANTNNINTKGTALIKIAEIYEGQGKYQEAISALNDITDPSLKKGVASHKSVLESKVKK